MPIYDERKLNSDASKLRSNWAKNDIKLSAEESRKKLDLIVDEERIDSELARQQEERMEARRKLYEKQGKTGVSVAQTRSDVSNLLYRAKTEAQKNPGLHRRREGFIHRTLRLIKGFAEAEKTLSKRPFATMEKADVLYGNILRDAWAPIVEDYNEALDTLWDFLCNLGRDAWNIVLYLADGVIAVAYYITSFVLYIWDVIWDIRYAIEKNKARLFLWFSSGISTVAVILILISSVSAYEYSYYGKTLGLAKSKQDVYESIEILGDKLSRVTGANINIDVERDIEFKRVFGFKMDVDTTDDILTTLTYMKDLQTQAYAVCVNEEQMVILESEEAAKTLIAQIRNDYAGVRTGVEYSTITFEEMVTIEPVSVLLADVWNPEDALRYMETGTVEEEENWEEGYEAKSIVTVHSMETQTYEAEVDFEIEYIENSSMYTDETKLISDGVLGKDVIIASVERINGEEIGRTILSTTRISNPISATYYQGTKPIPEKKGTGTWIWPLKVEALRTSEFHEKYGIVGVSTVHQGVDYGVAIGTKIYAADGGTVSFAGYRSGYGYCVEIDHGGLYTSIYGHCSKLLVKTGATVYQGQNIALSGNTGVSTGPHLHFEIQYKGIAIDPLQFYPDKQ